MAHSAAARRAYLPLHGCRERDLSLGYITCTLNTYLEYMITMTYATLQPSNIRRLTQLRDLCLTEQRGLTLGWSPRVSALAAVARGRVSWYQLLQQRHCGRGGVGWGE